MCGFLKTGFSQKHECTVGLSVYSQFVSESRLFIVILFMWFLLWFVDWLALRSFDLFLGRVDDYEIVFY